MLASRYHPPFPHRWHPGRSFGLHRRPLALPAINHCPSSVFRTSRCCRTTAPHRHLRPTSIHAYRQWAGIHRPISPRKGGRNAFEKTLTDNRIQQKNGRPVHPQPKAKLNGSTKHSNAGSKPNQQQKQSANHNDNSTKSPPTTTRTAPTGHEADAHRTRSTQPVQKPSPTTTPNKRGAPATTPCRPTAKSPSATPAGSTT